jgi:putative phosphoribosyl transferase
MSSRFRDRRVAGQRLAHELRHHANRRDVIVLALPRGGVPVGFEVASARAAPLDVFVVRKLGLPWHEELAMGAIASGGVNVLDRRLIRVAGVSDAELARVIASEEAELHRRERLYRGDRAFPDVRGRTVILVDDGLATGATMRVTSPTKWSAPRRPKASRRSGNGTRISRRRRTRRCTNFSSVRGATAR